jgi:hypothetical protein
MLTTYQVSVRTGKLDSAGTDARVYITLLGEKGDSGERQLDNSRNNFERGCQDVFSFEMEDLGNLHSARIRHDNSGDKPGWHLDKVAVYTEAMWQRGGFHFPCGNWLAVNEGGIDRTLQVALPPQNPGRAEFDIDRMGVMLQGWNKKGGTAAEYQSAGSDYRTYQPTISRRADDGLLITTKLDHIRNGLIDADDDHAQLVMEFDRAGRILSARSNMKIQGVPQFDTGLIRAAGDLYSPEAGRIAEVSAEILNSLINFVSRSNETGGRANFPSVVQHNLNMIAKCVIQLAAFTIRAKWESLGGANGFLGSPTTDELPTPDGVGRFNHFQGGSIYWTPDTGAWEVHGAIRDKWAALGWETNLGYPITDEMPTLDGMGRFNHFRRLDGGHASVYWTAQTGAWEVHGLIRTKWAALGYERSALGYPISDEMPTPDGAGRLSSFQGGTIYWAPDRDTWVE